MKSVAGDTPKGEFSPQHGELPTLSSCQARFGRISQRTRELWQHPLLQADSSPRLRNWGEQALALSRTIYDELIFAAASDRTDDTATQHLRTLTEMQSANEALLGWLTDRVHAAEMFRPFVRCLRETINHVVSGEETSFSSLRGIAAEFVSAVRLGPPLTLDTAADVRVLADIFLPNTDWQDHRDIPVLLAAWWLARGQQREGLAAESRRRAVIAALMQDIGLANGPTVSVRDAAMTPFQPFHPATGAAILAGLSGVPAEISLLVGTHHERIDGSGFPQRLSGARLSKTSQQLAWTVRLAELVVDPATVQQTMETGEALDVLAGIRIWREVERGAFDRVIARDGFDLIRPRLADEVVTRYPQHYRRFLEPLNLNGSRTLPHRTDPAATTSAVLGPRFLNRRRSVPAARNIAGVEVSTP